MQLTKEMVDSKFTYVSGELYRKDGKRSGKRAGGKDSTGYIQLWFEGRKTHTHRLIFLMFNGYLPKFIDHINGNRSDNRIENLRAATKSQNSMNSSKTAGCSSQYKGVLWSTQRGKWQARLIIKPKQFHLGFYESESDAARAYNAEALIRFGEFAKLNVIEGELDG